MKLVILQQLELWVYKIHPIRREWSHAAQPNCCSACSCVRRVVQEGDKYIHTHHTLRFSAHWISFFNATDAEICSSSLLLMVKLCKSTGSYFSLIVVFWSVNWGLRDWHSSSKSQSATSAVLAVQSATPHPGFHNHVVYTTLYMCIFILSVWNTFWNQFDG